MGIKYKGKKGKKKNELKVFGEKVTKLIEKNVPTNPSKWDTTKHKLRRSSMFILRSYATDGQVKVQRRWWLEKG